jgi:hypothetical protein
VADDDAGFRPVVAVVDRRAVAVAAGDETAAFGFGAVDLAAAGLAATGFAAVGFARALDRAGEAARDEAGAVADRALAGGLSSLICAVSWTTSARASDACFFRFASTSRAFWRRFSSRASSFPASLAAPLGPAVPAD